MIGSEADASQNHFNTNSLTTENIENLSEMEFQSVSVGTSSGGIAPVSMATGSALQMLGNTDEEATSTTRSAVGNNIQLNVTNGVPMGLSRDTENTNQQVNEYSKEEYEETAEIGRVVADIAKNTKDVVTYEERKKLSEAKRQLERAEEAQEKAGQDINNAQTDAERNEAIERYNNAQNEIDELAGLPDESGERKGGKVDILQEEYDKNYGVGSEFYRTVAIAEGAAKGLLTDNLAQAGVAVASPYLNTEIKKATTDANGNVDLATNLALHAALGGLEAAMLDGDIASGALAGAGSEYIAGQLAKSLYGVGENGKTIDKLTSQQKEALVTLTQMATMMASKGLTGDNYDAIQAGEIAKRAVENNYLTVAQEKQRLEELKNCKGGYWCQLKVNAYWGSIDTGQDLSFGGGFTAGIPVNLYDSAKALGSALLHPIDTLKAISTMIEQDDAFSKVATATKEAYQKQIHRLITEYEKGGLEGSFNAGVETGKLFTDIVFTVSGAGAAKTAAVSTAKAVVKTVQKGVKNGIKTTVKNGGKKVLSNVEDGLSAKVKQNKQPVYDERTLKRMDEDMFHNFPVSFDKSILSQNPIIRLNGRVEYLQKGKINGVEGIFHITLEKSTNIIRHRAFIPKRDWSLYSKRWDPPKIENIAK